MSGKRHNRSLVNKVLHRVGMPKPISTNHEVICVGRSLKDNSGQ